MGLHSLDCLCNKVTLIRSFRPSKIALGKKQSRSTYMYIHNRDGTSSGSKGLDVDAPTNLFHDFFFLYTYTPTTQPHSTQCIRVYLFRYGHRHRPTDQVLIDVQDRAIRGVHFRPDHCEALAPAAADADNVNIAFYWARALFV